MHRRFGRHQPLVRRDECVDDRRIVHGPATLQQDGDRGLVRHARSIRAVRRQCVETVDDRQDAGANRDVGSTDSVGVPRAVPVLVVMPHDRDHGIGKVDRGENLRADRRVQLHLLEFGGRQLARLVEDVLGHRDLPGVVQQRSGFDRFERLLVGDADFARQSHRGGLHASDVAVRHLVLGIDRGRQRLDGREIHPIEFLDVSLRVLQPAERRSHRQIRNQQQRQDERDDAEVHLPERHDEEKGDRRACGIRRRQWHEVLAPHAKRAAAALGRNDGSRETAVYEEIGGRKCHERDDQATGRSTRLRQRRNAGDEKEQPAGRPDRECQIADVEGREGQRRASVEGRAGGRRS